MIDAALRLAQILETIPVPEELEFEGLPEEWDFWLAWNAGSETIGSIGTDIFTGVARPSSDSIPNNAIFAAVYDGVSEKTFDNQSETTYHAVNLYIRARHSEDSRGFCFFKAKTIYEHLQKFSEDDLLDISVLNAPIQLAYDNQGNAAYSMNVQIIEHYKYN